MKRFILYLLMTGMLLPFLFGCDTEHPTYTKHLPAKTEDISWEDRMTEDAITVSSVLSYSREEIDLPAGIQTRQLLKYTYTTADGIYIPVKKQTGGQYHYRTTIYHYDMEGNPVWEIEIPCETETAELFHVLSDDRILLLKTKDVADFSKVTLQLIDNSGTVLFESPEFSFSNAVQTYLDNFAHGMHVTEAEDGTVQILVNAIDRVYYFDESLALLSEIALPAECAGITPLSDGVYMIGSQMPSVCKVDLNNGTAELTDVPVLPEMKYHSTFHCGGDGKLYCAYEDAIYLCQQDDSGGDTMHRLMNWYQGACDGQGYFWIVNENCLFYVPMSSMGYKSTMYILNPGSSPDLQNRRVITLVMVIKDDWLLDTVSLFNEMNDDYYILCVDMTQIVDGDAPIDRFDSYLLDGNKPDLVYLHLFYRQYSNKNLLLDLSADYGDRLIRPLRNSYTEGNGAMYALPLSAKATLYACKSSLLDGPLTWDDMYDLGDELKASEPEDHMALTTVDFEIGNIYNMIQPYVDYETKTSSFHCDEFHRQVRFKEEMMDRYVVKEYGTFGNNGFDTGGRYGVIDNIEIISALEDGRVKLAYFPFISLEGYASLKLFFGDTQFSLCGYPSDDSHCYNVNMSSTGSLAVFSDSTNLGGCKEFLDFLLSDDMQTSELLTQQALPVTRTALEKAIDQNRYYYYNKQPVEIGKSIGTGGVWLLDAQAVSAQPDPSKSSIYETVEITDEDKERILSFFDNSKSYYNPDEVINKILNEELSVYRAGARTLEETTKIIDSRVWIYLNE
ncbi:MAG: extracellular solute-binding protein [Clostridia bacterium]|nr:extracellular solute-binding protein [Clostridia bacterium]